MRYLREARQVCDFDTIRRNLFLGHLLQFKNIVFDVFENFMDGFMVEYRLFRHQVYR